MRLLLTLLALSSAAAAQTTATYAVRLDASWSAATHPDAFPPDPHFSPLVTVTHSAARSLWRLGETASPGMEQMAETGGTSLLVGEAQALGADALEVRVGPSVAVSPGSSGDLTFTLDEAHPALTLVTMLAPSPDWFVGVDGLVLLDAGAWLPSFVVDLYAIDAGTDSGTSYTSPNADTVPREPIARLEGAPFAPGGTLRQVGTLTVTRLSVASGDTPAAPGLAVRAAAPARPGGPVWVDAPAAGALRVELFTVTGRRVAVLHDAPASGTLRLALPSALAPGAYVVRAATPAQAASRVVTVVR